jgi:hypothetical protein
VGAAGSLWLLLVIKIMLPKLKIKKSKCSEKVSKVLFLSQNLVDMFFWKKEWHGRIFPSIII